MDIQRLYENVVILTHCGDKCYAKCMNIYRKHIEDNFNVQTFLEFPEHIWEMYNYNIGDVLSLFDENV